MRTNTRTVTLLAAIMLAVAASPRAAFADECRDGDHACAVKFFEAGRILVQAGDCTSAIPAFEESIAHQPSVGALLNLGDCEAKTGAVASAYNHYRAAERLAADTNDARTAVSQQSAAAVEGRVLRIRLVAASEGSPPAVRVDGVALSSAQVALALAGRYALEPSANHTVSVTDTGDKSWTRTVWGPAGTLLVVAAEPEHAAAQATSPGAAAAPTSAAPATTATTPASSPSHGSALRVAGLALGGTGLAAIAVGTVMGFVAMSKRDDARAACTKNGGSYPGHCTGSDQSAVLSANDAARNAALVSSIALAAGGIALGTGLVLYLSASPAPGGGPGGASASVGLGGTW